LSLKSISFFILFDFLLALKIIGKSNDNDNEILLKSNFPNLEFKKFVLKNNFQL